MCTVQDINMLYMAKFYIAEVLFTLNYAQMQNFECGLVYNLTNSLSFIWVKQINKKLPV